MCQGVLARVCCRGTAGALQGHCRGIAGSVRGVRVGQCWCSARALRSRALWLCSWVRVVQRCSARFCVSTGVRVGRPYGVVNVSACTLFCYTCSD